MGHGGIRIDAVTDHCDFFRMEAMSIKDALEHIGIRFSESYIRLTACRMLYTFAYRAAIDKDNFLVSGTNAVRVGRDVRHSLRCPP